MMAHFYKLQCVCVCACTCVCGYECMWKSSCLPQLLFTLHLGTGSFTELGAH